MELACVEKMRYQFPIHANCYAWISGVAQTERAVTYLKGHLTLWRLFVQNQCVVTTPLCDVLLSRCAVWPSLPVNLDPWSSGALIQISFNVKPLQFTGCVLAKFTSMIWQRLIGKFETPFYLMLAKISDLFKKGIVHVSLLGSIVPHTVRRT